jgi:spermidine/putrescine transport system ATP-binding protein
MSDRIAVMNRGVIEQLDEPETIYERPRTTFVAGFIGVSNLMPGEVVSANGGAPSVRLDAGPTVGTGELGGATPGERVHAVVRPEKLGLESADSASSADSTSVEGQVESSLYLGTATQFVVRLPDGVAMTVLVPNADESERQSLPAAGVPVRLSWASEHTHVVREAEAARATAAARREMGDDSNGVTSAPGPPARPTPEEQPK